MPSSCCFRQSWRWGCRCGIAPDALDDLVRLGFDLCASGKGVVTVKGLPQEAAEGDPAALLDAVLTELREAGEVDAELRASRATPGWPVGPPFPRAGH